MNYLVKCLICEKTGWVGGPVCADPETGSLDIEDDDVADALDCKCPLDYEIIDSEPAARFPDDVI